MSDNDVEMEDEIMNDSGGTEKRIRTHETKQRRLFYQTVAKHLPILKKILKTNDLVYRVFTELLRYHDYSILGATKPFDRKIMEEVQKTCESLNTDRAIKMLLYLPENIYMALKREVILANTCLRGYPPLSKDIFLAILYCKKSLLAGMAVENKDTITISIPQFHITNYWSLQHVFYDLVLLARFLRVVFMHRHMVTTESTCIDYLNEDLIFSMLYAGINFGSHRVISRLKSSLHYAICSQKQIVNQFIQVLGPFFEIEMEHGELLDISHSTKVKNLINELYTGN